MKSVKEDAHDIIQETIQAVLPEAAVKKVLEQRTFTKNLYLIAIGKAAWRMANAAHETLRHKIIDGLVITKYHHSQGPITNFKIIEAAHPTPDHNSFTTGKIAKNFVSNLSQGDEILFLISGGGSSLFEEAIIPEDEVTFITDQLLKKGANIVEINTIRKRLSLIKGGQFAQYCSPRKIYCIVLSDIINDPLDMIAGGPLHKDRSTCEQALAIAKKYDLTLSPQAQSALSRELTQDIHNVETVIAGSVNHLCDAAYTSCLMRGYQPMILTNQLSCEARQAGYFLGDIANYYQNSTHSIALIVGGETVVYVKGNGRGGRNQELALAAATRLTNCRDTVIFSIGSDGTDGPTDAAGGMVDEMTQLRIKNLNLSIDEALKDNNSYVLLDQCDGLIKTGPTGTNVNDLSVILIKR